MKYLLFLISLVLLTSCRKTQMCFKCEVTYKTYLYTPNSGRDTSYILKDDMCNVTREYVERYVAENSDTIAIQNRKDVNGNTFTEYYVRNVDCERYFK